MSIKNINNVIDEIVNLIPTNLDPDEDGGDDKRRSLRAGLISIRQSVACAAPELAGLHLGRLLDLMDGANNQREELEHNVDPWWDDVGKVVDGYLDSLDHVKPRDY